MLPGPMLDLATVARHFRAGEVQPMAFVACFKVSRVYVFRPAQPGFMVAKVGDMGRWVRVYSSADRLLELEGDVRWMAMLGVVAMKLVPADVGLVLDPHLPHSVAVPPSGVTSTLTDRSTKSETTNGTPGGTGEQ
jgi:hypothetical protein